MRWDGISFAKDGILLGKRFFKVTFHFIFREKYIYNELFTGFSFFFKDVRYRRENIYFVTAQSTKGF